MNLLINYIVTFGFVPLNKRTQKKYIKGLTNIYDKDMQDFKQRNPFYSLPFDQQLLINDLPAGDPKYMNLERGKAYLEDMTDLVKGKSNVAGDLEKLVPLTTHINGKQTTVGIRHLYANTAQPGKNPKYYGNTVGHPKYKNYGSKALVETMINHAQKTPNEIHYISGANPGLNRLYNRVAKKFSNIPPNLHLP